MSRRKKSVVARRAFLKSLGVGAASLPFVRFLGDGTAHAAGDFPQRFVVFFSPNGTIRESWVPSGSETDFTLPRILEPLEPFRDQLLILSGLDMRSTSRGPGDGHQKGMGHMLTGAELLPGNTVGGGDPPPPGVSWASSISVDQRIANHVWDGSGRRSVELGVHVGESSDVWTRMCYRGAGEPLPPIESAADALGDLFSGATEDPVQQTAVRDRKQSVVDFVKGDLDRVRTRVGSFDRMRLDQHLTAVRDIERRIQDATLFACREPELAAENDLRDTGRLQMDILAAAMACDVTRVGSIQWTNSVGQGSYPWLGFNDRHHDLSHEGDSNSDAIGKIVEINRWYAEQFAYLLGKLAEFPEGDGTVLDNTCVLWCNELGRGNSHTRNNVPYVLGGSAGGVLRTGRFLELDRPHNDFLLTLCRAYGIEDGTFGDPDFNTGSIGELF